MFESFLNTLRAGAKVNFPTCGRYAQVYRRHVNKTMAIQLHKAMKTTAAGEYIHTRDLVIGTSSGDFPKLKHWKLIGAKPSDEEDSGKKDSGWWRVTPLGREFVRGNAAIPKWLHIYDDRVIKYEGETTLFKGCLGKGFDYSELNINR